MNNVFSKDS